jgi:hypothetical protein
MYTGKASSDTLHRSIKVSFVFLERELTAWWSSPISMWSSSRLTAKKISPWANSQKCLVGETAIGVEGPRGQLLNM